MIRALFSVEFFRFSQKRQDFLPFQQAELSWLVTCMDGETVSGGNENDCVSVTA